MLMETMHLRKFFCPWYCSSRMKFLMCCGLRSRLWLRTVT